MAVQTEPTRQDAVVYPEGDDQPMADNPIHYRWIVTLKENLDEALPHYVAADNFWYPVEGQPRIVVAPDVYVAVGRPKGIRRTYKQWEEDDVPLRAVFEIVSPSNSATEIARKMSFYGRYGVDEFYLIDPDVESKSIVSVRRDGRLQTEPLDGFESPLLGIRFAIEEDGLTVYHADGRRFLTWEEHSQRTREAEARAESLAAKLRELGIDPDELG